MAKKTKQALSNVSPSSGASPKAEFPDLKPKRAIECRTLLQDQILLLDDVLTVEECKIFVKFIEGLPLELTPPKKRGEADRVNHRYSITSPEFADKLHALLTPHLPSFPYPTSVKKQIATDEPRLPSSFNSNIRLYKYTPSQHFGPHYDDAVRDPQTGHKSEWTLLIYLSGAEDGVEGGETLFYKEERGRPREVITAPLARGMALLHRCVFASLTMEPRTGCFCWANNPCICATVIRIPQIH
ncbi:hypothetical protein PLICRDRAFT_41836 [Plicaturopsis crispa FD-325 SS-3]|nr:hypothetical protein PLICRDRAFT_41836 [Plicaturopsis crispa FD-325 SS-3]